jgi:RNA polymerase sigma-70 factor (ECF subfamily)
MNGVITGGSTFVAEVYAARDDAGFRQAFDQNYRDILACAKRRSSVADAADIAAEVFIITWRKWASAPSGAVRPWLFGIGRKVPANNNRTHRRRARLSARLTSLGERPGTDPHRGGHDDLNQAMAMLRSSDQDIIRLHCREDLSGSEIAVVLGCSANAASIRLHRAKEQLGRAPTYGRRS